MQRVSRWLGVASLLLTGCASGTASPTLDRATSVSETVVPTPAPTPVTGLQPAADKLRSSAMPEPVYFSLPGMDRVMVDNVPYREGSTMDVYYPPDFDPAVPAPAVIFVIGVSDSAAPTPFKEMGQYISWGQLVAASGLIGITYEVPSDPYEDTQDAITYVWENGPGLGINPDRFCLWSCSAHTAMALRVLTDGTSDYRDSLACGVFYYGDMVTFNPLRSDVPLLVVEAGLDSAGTNRRIGRFVEEAEEAGVDIEFVTYPDGVHGFEVEQDTSETRDIVKRTLEFLKTHLLTP